MMRLPRHRNRISGDQPGVGNRYCAPVTAGAQQQQNGPTVRRARTSDVPAIKRLVDTYAGKILLEKNLVTLYEAVQETWVAELDGEPEDMVFALPKELRLRLVG